MKNRIKLTTTAVDKLRCPEGDEPTHIIWDTQTPGLGVRVSKTGKKTYFFQRRVKGGGKERNVSLGRHGDPALLDGTLRTYPFGADDARARAAAVLAQLLAGVDPVAEQERKETEAAAQAAKDDALSTTLRQVIDHYLEHHRVKGRPLRPKTKRDYREFMERKQNFADWLDQPCAGFTRDKCLARITEIEKRSPVLAHKASTYLSLFLNHAREMHADPATGQYQILVMNPVERARKIKATHPPTPRDRRIPAEKVGAVWLMLRRRAALPVRDIDRTAADWVSSLLLTGWRATECAALEWTWINFDAKTITLPGDVDTTNERLFAGVKNHRGITYPMSDALYDILKARSELESKHETYVFPSRADTKLPYIATAHGTMSELVKIAGLHLSPHDLRRTAESAALACHVDYSLRQRLLNHKPQGVHDTSYGNDPSPEILRPAVNAIAKYILDAARVAEAQATGANIIAFPTRAS